METTTTTQSLELFMSALLGQNYSPKTLRAYRDDLKQFIQWVGENRASARIRVKNSRIAQRAEFSCVPHA
jgi:site-specific recombinase XerD